MDVLLSGDCYYCGKAPANGIDRIDSSRKYEKGNVVSCCSTCNYGKREMSTDEFLSWIRRVYEHKVKTEA
jgi:hypothetical protein